MGQKVQAAKAIHKAKSFKDSVGKKVAEAGKQRPKSDKVNYTALPSEGDIESESKPKRKASSKKSMKSDEAKATPGAASETSKGEPKSMIYLFVARD